MAPLFKISVLLLVFASTVCAQDIAGQEAALLNQLLVGYDKRFPPPGEKAILVRTNLFIRSIEKISTFDMQMTAQLTHRRTYTDSRLSFGNDTGLDYITVRDPSVLWTPDSFFSNGFSMETHNQVARIRPTGEVFLSERVSGTFDCPMNLRNYPFDVQVCFIQIGSYSYVVDKQTLVWDPDLDEPVQIPKQLHLPDFSLTNFESTYATSKSASGEYSSIRLNMFLKRESGYILMTAYVPMVLLVIVSYLSFFIGANDQPLKSTISLLCLGTLVIALTILNQELPYVSYTKAFDVWAGTCVTFIFVALIESVVAYLCNRTCCKKTEPDQAKDSGDNNANDESGRTQDDTCKRTELGMINWIFIVLFPIWFIIFIIVYFWYYC